MLYRFPNGFEKRPERAPGSIDEVQTLDGAAEICELRDAKLARGCGLIVRGWTFDPVTMEPAAHVILTAGDQVSAEPTYGLSRPDIAQAFEKSALEATGFKGIVSTGSLALGPHEIRLYAVTADSKYSECPSTYSFELMPSAWQVPDLPKLSSSSFAAAVDELSPVELRGDDSPVVPQRSILVVRGYALDMNRAAPCKALYVRIGVECRRAVYGVPRESLPESIARSAEARFSGFTARFNTSTIAPGTHDVTLIAVSNDGSGIAEIETKTSLSVSSEVHSTA